MMDRESDVQTVTAQLEEVKRCALRNRDRSQKCRAQRRAKTLLNLPVNGDDTDINGLLLELHNLTIPLNIWSKEKARVVTWRILAFPMV